MIENPRRMLRQPSEQTTPCVDPARRALLTLAPGAAALAALAACTPNHRGSDTSGLLGPARHVVWAVGTTGSDFVMEISLGAADAAQMLGWRFTRILNAQSSPDAHINAIRQAVTMHADVVVTVDWYQAVVDEIAAGQKAGVTFAIVNSMNNPDTLLPLHVPFVGQQPRDTGRMMGARIAETLAARGVSTGSVLAGNPFPGSLNVEQRIQGIAEGLAASGSALKLVSFPDGAAQDAASSVALYKAKITQTGNVVAHAVAGGEMSAIPLAKSLAELQQTTSRPVTGGWVSSLKVLDLIKSGTMDFALDENLYYQGFMAVLLTWSMLERQMPASMLGVGYSWVTADNVDAMIASYDRRKSSAVQHGLA
jgi:simple sugar transport system substrate-binding protein